MKIYPKTYQDLAVRPSDYVLAKMGSIDGSLDQLALRFRNFYREMHPVFFDILVREVWLEQQYAYDGIRHKRNGNGLWHDKSFGFFIKAMVGISQKPFTMGTPSHVIPTYFRDFFPNFLDRDPFKEPEYFKYPYHHVTLDHLMFVYNCPERLEMLAEAEEKEMSIFDFVNWIYNYLKSYNDEVGKEVYVVKSRAYNPYMQKLI